jgi:hypothetical protein
MAECQFENAEGRRDKGKGIKIKTVKKNGWKLKKTVSLRK